MQCLAAATVLVVVLWWFVGGGGREVEAAGRVGEGLARELARGFPLVINILNQNKMNWQTRHS